VTLLLALVLALAPTEQFDRAKLAYDRNEYARVIALVRPLLYPSIQLSSQEQVIEAHRLLGIASFKTHDEAEAEKEFSILLNSNPDFHLDRLVDGAEVAQFVDRMRQNMEDELRRVKELERQREEEVKKRRGREEEERRKHPIYVDREVRLIEHPFAVNFLPFGAGQFQNGEVRKGYALLVSESVLAVTSLSIWLVEQELYPNGRASIQRNSQGVATTLQVARLSTGFGFYALWAVGAYDAIKHWVPMTKVYVPSPMPVASGVGVEWTGRF